MSTRSKGNYYVKKTMDWLESEGYVAEKVELTRTWVTQNPRTSGWRIGSSTKDLWGCDVIARNRDRCVFIQVKANKGDISSGVKQLSIDDQWPPTVERWVVYWPPRQRIADGPIITEV